MVIEKSRFNVVINQNPPTVSPDTIPYIRPPVPSRLFDTFIHPPLATHTTPATLEMQNLTTARLRDISAAERYSDLNIVCQHRVLKVHKYIVCSKSSVFDAVCEGNESKVSDSYRTDEDTISPRLMNYLGNTHYDRDSGIPPDDSKANDIMAVHTMVQSRSGGV